MIRPGNCWVPPTLLSTLLTWNLLWHKRPWSPSFSSAEEHTEANCLLLSKAGLPGGAQMLMLPLSIITHCLDSTSWSMIVTSCPRLRKDRSARENWSSAGADSDFLASSLILNESKKLVWTPMHSKDLTSYQTMMDTSVWSRLYFRGLWMNQQCSKGTIKWWVRYIQASSSRYWESQRCTKLLFCVSWAKTFGVTSYCSAVSLEDWPVKPKLSLHLCECLCCADLGTHHTQGASHEDGDIKNLSVPGHTHTLPLC